MASCRLQKRYLFRASLSASPSCEGERIEVRGFLQRALCPQSVNPHPALSLGKGEAGNGPNSYQKGFTILLYKTTLSALLIVAILFGAFATSGRAEESVGTKIKKIFAPTPTPAPTRKHRKRSANKTTPTPSPTTSPRQKKISPTPSPSPTPKRKSKHKKATPSPTEEIPSPSPTETPQQTSSPSPPPGRKGAPNVTLSPDEIAGYDAYPARVRQIIEAGLDLTKKNLGYAYGSADPANGGMDCSGFIYYLLSQNGFTDVPRDSSQQYVWVRKAGNFNAVLSRHQDSFELDALKPGDLLFWSGTYNIDRDPPITHTMIYLGREKRTKKRVMPPPPNSNDAKISPVFVGYGRIPGLIGE